MSADLSVAPTVTLCAGCGSTPDDCYVLRDDCCHGCTHYPEPEALGPDVDLVAVERACAGDTSVALNRAEAAEAHRRLRDAGKSIRQIADVLGTAERNVDRWNNGHTRPISRRPGGAMNDDTSIDALLTRAARSDSARIRAAAHKVQDAVQRLRDAYIEDESKREARERVARLEAELAAAKAALRGKPSTPKAIRPQVAPVDGGIPCPNDCGKVSVNAAGASAHARFCTVEKAAS